MPTRPRQATDESDVSDGAGGDCRLLEQARRLRSARPAGGEAAQAFLQPSGTPEKVSIFPSTADRGSNTFQKATVRGVQLLAIRSIRSIRGSARRSDAASTAWRTSQLDAPLASAFICVHLRLCLLLRSRTLKLHSSSSSRIRGSSAFPGREADGPRIWPLSTLPRWPTPSPRSSPAGSATGRRTTPSRRPTPATTGFDPEAPKFYVLDMFPYPSGVGLHVGHPLGYIATDIVARHKRMNGFHVLHPMGFDAFGLPAEQFAIEHNVHPRVTTEKNIETMVAQLKSLGLGYDWSRRLATTDPGFVKWTQWCFLQMHGSYFDPVEKKAAPIAHLVEKLEGEDYLLGITGELVWSGIDEDMAALSGLPIGTRKWHTLTQRRAERRARQPAARLPRRGGGELVPEAGHRPRQRGGEGRRPQRAGQPPGDQAAAEAVDAADHRLRGASRRRPRRPRLARAGEAAAAELDRPEHRRRGRLRRRRARRRRGGLGPRREDHRLHHAARHALRRHLHGARPRAPAGRRPHHAGAEAGRRRLRRPLRRDERRGAAGRGGQQIGCRHRRLRGEPSQRRPAAGVDRRLRADGLRHRRDHGGAGPRHARPRLRRAARPADRAGDRRPRRRRHGLGSVDRHRPADELRKRGAGPQRPRPGDRHRGHRRLPGAGGPRPREDAGPSARLAVQPAALLGRALPDPARAGR